MTNAPGSDEATGNESSNAAALAAELRHIEDELVYVIECLSQTLTGEAKHELSLLADYVSKSTVLPPTVAHEVVTCLRTARESLIMQSEDLQVRTDVAALRRRLFNAVAELTGRPKKYTYEPLQVAAGRLGN